MSQANGVQGEWGENGRLYSEQQGHSPEQEPRTMLSETHVERIKISVGRGG